MEDAREDGRDICIYIYTGGLPVLHSRGNLKKNICLGSWLFFLVHSRCSTVTYRGKIDVRSIIRILWNNSLKYSNNVLPQLKPYNTFIIYFPFLCFSCTTTHHHLLPRDDKWLLVIFCDKFICCREDNSITTPCPRHCAEDIQYLSRPLSQM